MMNPAVPPVGPPPGPPPGPPGSSAPADLPPGPPPRPPTSSANVPSLAPKAEENTEILDGNVLDALGEVPSRVDRAHLAAADVTNPDKTGNLKKLAGKGFMKSWQKRYFVLKDAFLYYYKTETDLRPYSYLNLCDYTKCLEATEIKKKNTFLLKNPGSARAKVYVFMGDNEKHMKEWLEAIQTNIKLNFHPNRHRPRVLRQRRRPTRRPLSARKSLTTEALITSRPRFNSMTAAPHQTLTPPATPARASSYGEASLRPLAASTSARRGNSPHTSSPLASGSQSSPLGFSPGQVKLRSVTPEKSSASAPKEPSNFSPPKVQLRPVSKGSPLPTSNFSPSEVKLRPVAKPASSTAERTPPRLPNRNSMVQQPLTATSDRAPPRLPNRNSMVQQPVSSTSERIPPRLPNRNSLVQPLANSPPLPRRNTISAQASNSPPLPRRNANPPSLAAGAPTLPVRKPSPQVPRRNPVPGGFSVGASCSAQYYEDKQWYSARVDKVLPSGNYLVTFVDYGNQEEVTKDQVKRQ